MAAGSVDGAEADLDDATVVDEHAAILSLGTEDDEEKAGEQ